EVRRQLEVRTQTSCVPLCITPRRPVDVTTRAQHWRHFLRQPLRTLERPATTESEQRIRGHRGVTDERNAGCSELRPQDARIVDLPDDVRDAFGGGQIRCL